jgi:hypothetical protein
MLFIRKTSFIAVLVAASVGSPPLGSPPVPTHNSGQPPVIGVAILPERMRVRRRARFASFRAIAWRVLRRRRRGAAGIEAQGPRLSSRRPLRDSYARGPPRAESCLRCLFSRAASRRPAMSAARSSGISKLDRTRSDLIVYRGQAK